MPQPPVHGIMGKEPALEVALEDGVAGADDEDDMVELDVVGLVDGTDGEEVEEPADQQMHNGRQRQQ